MHFAQKKFISHLKMAGTYKFFAYAGGLLYLQLYIWVIFPQIFVFLQNMVMPGDSLILENSFHTNSFRSLLMVVAPIGFIYIYAAYTDALSLIDLTIVWRLFWVGPWLFNSTLNDNALEASAAMVIASLDIGIPLMAIFMNPSEAVQIPKRLSEAFTKTPQTLSRNILLTIGRVGILLVAAIAILVSDNYVQGFIISVTACYYFFYDWFARSHIEGVVFFVGFLEAIVIATLLINWLVFDYDNPLAIQAVLAYASITTLLHIYSVGWENFVLDGPKLSYGSWSFYCCTIVVGVSAVWVLFMPLFNEKIQMIFPNQHRFDLMLALFVVLVCVLMDEVKGKTPFHAQLNGFFLPFALLWYSTEVKILIGYHGGSPFHPTWIARGYTDKLYSGNFVLDVSYSLITILITAVGTTYGAVTVLLNFEPKVVLFLHH